MMRLHESTVDAVREKARIVDLFDQPLKRVGAEFVATCPWHEDKRPSLTVSPKTNRVFCFVCNRGADAIGWIQDRQGLSFTEAVQQLADRLGIEVRAAEEEDAKKLEAERAERAVLLNQRAKQVQLFHDRVWDSPALDYLLERGITGETIEDWKLGWNGERVMIPLSDPQGRVIAFTGRALNGALPKYKNSKNDLLYQKSEMVFGLDRARSEAIKKGQLVITEGQFDVIQCWQEGLRNVVAVSGSSLTRQMISQIVRSTRLRQIVLCFDGDLAGGRAAMRAVNELKDLAVRGDLELKVLTLPEGRDPADCASEMSDLVANAPHWVQWWFERDVGEPDKRDPHDLARAESSVRTILKALPEGALREYVKRESKRVLQAVPNVAPIFAPSQLQVDRCQWAERRAIRLYLLDPDSRPALSTLSFKEGVAAEAWGLIQLLEGMGTTAAQLRGVFSEVIQQAEEALFDELRPLVKPIPEVLRVIEANPVNELEGAMNVLLSSPCQDANSDCMGKLS